MLSHVHHRTSLIVAQETKHNQRIFPQYKTSMFEANIQSDDVEAKLFEVLSLFINLGCPMMITN